MPHNVARGGRAMRFRNLISDKSGNVMLITAAALPMLVGAAGMATDTVELSMLKRVLQQEADAAALAAAAAGSQSAGISDAATHEISAMHKLTVTSTTVENPPSAGTYAGDTAAIRVRLTSYQKLAFSSLFLTSGTTLTAEATTKMVSMGTFCVLAVGAGSTTGITMSGNATLSLGCGMATNSSASTAIDGSGSISVSLSSLTAVGGIPSSSSYSGVSLYPHSLKQTDPFASLSNPTFTGCSGNTVVNANSTRTLSPGCYGGLDLKGNVTLQPGTYYIDAGNFSVGAQAVISGTGVTIVLTSSTAATQPQSIGQITINAGAQLNLTAPGTGTYAGILFYQDRRAQDTGTNTINGNASSVLQGAMYIPSQSVTYNGTSGMTTDCLQMVVKRATFSGNSTISNVCPSGSGAHSFTGTTVKLVA
ncbi:MAG: hypothetical protein JF593_14350 [Novosphingobium sp.]|nr:hypothetical protein [Novosphingobium sp.]